MTSFPTYFSKHGKKVAVLSLIVAGSLGLAGCSAPTESNKTVASEIPAPPPADSGVKPVISKNTEGAFSNEEGFGVPFSSSKKNTLKTPDGGLSRFKGSSGEEVISFTSYKKDGKGNWEFTVPAIKDASTNSSSEENSAGVQLLRWEGKSYAVANQEATINTSASGLKAGSSVKVYNTYVLDLETGKLVNTVKAEKPTDASAVSDVFVPVSYAKPTERKIPFLNALITTGTVANASSYRVLDPLTSKVILESTGNSENVPYFSGTDFRDLDISALNQTYGGFKSTKPAGYFGNIVLLRSGYEYEVGAYNPRDNKNYSFYNMNNKTTVASMECENSSTSNEGSGAYSANFRYVVFNGTFVLDTQSGKTFCGAKTATRSGLLVTSIDNKGNMFGSNDAGKLLKVSIEDNDALVELYPTASHDVPESITSEGYGVFPSGDNTILLPLKK